MLQINKGDRIARFTPAVRYGIALSNSDTNHDVLVQCGATIETWQAYTYDLVPMTGDLVVLRYGAYAESLANAIDALKIHIAALTPGTDEHYTANREYGAQRNYLDQFRLKGDRTLDGLLTVMRQTSDGVVPQFRCKLNDGKSTKVLPLNCIALYARSIDNSNVLDHNRVK